MCRLGLAEYEAMEAFVIDDPAAPSRLYKSPLPDGRREKAALRGEELLANGGSPAEGEEEGAAAGEEGA